MRFDDSSGRVARPNAAQGSAFVSPGLTSGQGPLRFDAFIFDLDGTLADSLADIGLSMNEVLAGRGLPPHPVERYKDFVGEGAENLIRRAVTAAGGAPDDMPTLLEAYRERYAALEHDNSKPYPGVEAMLNAIVSSGRPMAVLSNKRDDFTKHLVAQAFGGFPFVDVRGERDGVPRKPDPTAAFELALALNVLPARIGFVGDTKIDAQTATRAGMISVGVLWGFRGRDELTQAGAKLLLERPEDLLAHLR